MMLDIAPTDLIALAALLVFVALSLSILIFQGLTGAPPYPSGSAEVASIIALIQQADLPDQAIIYELGCGWGTLVIALARTFPTAQIRGIELSPLPYWVARLRTRAMPNVLLQRRNFYHCDISDAQAVTCYLMQKLMPKLAIFLDRMLKPRTAVVALTFWFRDRDAAMVRQGRGLLDGTALYYWPARKINRPAAHPQPGWRRAR